MMPEVEQQSAAPGPTRPPAGLPHSSSSSSSSSHTALFGKYDLGRLLGCGAFAKVYYARDTRTGQSVAIKIINKQKITNPNLISNIKREISIMRRLRHPNIVKLFEVMATKTRIYFVMEFVKGGELFMKVSKGKFSEDLSRKYFQQLISAIGYCHSRGVYHRDLKPENLLVDENGDLKVSDFGLSAVTGQVRTDGLLHTLCGTPAYVAPEILTKKGYNGANIDVWSCGVVLFVLSAGFLPFNDPNLMMMYKKIYKGEYRCPKSMSSDLKRFISRLLDTNPNTRITVDEITHDPWFKKGYKPRPFYDIENEPVLKEGEDGNCSKEPLNAFDIIAFSSGLNLSGLFDDGVSTSCGERVVVAEDSPARVIERVEEIVKEEEVRRVRVKRRKEWGLEVEGQDGNLVFGMEVFRLTENLVVVEVRRKEGESGGGGLYQEFWRRRIMPELLGQPEGEVACCSN